MKKIAILQSNYIPWKGYFDLIASVDTFVLYDDMQYTRRDWRNRNKIKTADGLKWLTIPVMVKGKFHQKINETQTSNKDWLQQHWQQIEQNYKRAPHFDEVSEWLRPCYDDLKTETKLSSINKHLIDVICQQLNITTRIIHSSAFDLADDKTERLAHICQQAGATTYISGPAAKDYIDERNFTEKSINLEWADYSNYPEYPQLWGDFEHSVTILDLLFNTGSQAMHYMKNIK